MAGPVSSSSPNPVGRFFEECASIASGIPQLSTGRLSLQAKITDAYKNAILDVEQKMKSDGLLSSRDSDKVRILSEGSGTLALIDRAYDEALAKIAGGKVASGAIPVAAASSAPPTSQRGSIREGFAYFSRGMHHLQELGSAFLSPPRVTTLSIKGSPSIASIQNVFQKVVKGLEVPRLHPAESQSKGVASHAPQILEKAQTPLRVAIPESKAEGVASLAARISERDAFRKRFTTLLAKIHYLPETGPQESKLPYYAALIKEGLELLEAIDHAPHFMEEFRPQIDMLLSGIEYMNVEAQFLEEEYTNEADKLLKSCNKLLSRDPAQVDPRRREYLKKQITILISAISQSFFKNKLAEYTERLESIKVRL